MFYLSDIKDTEYLSDIKTKTQITSQNNRTRHHKVKKENSIKLDGINAHYTISETNLTFNRTNEN